MGYNASGDISVVVTEPQRVALALAWDQPRETLGLNDANDIVEQILAFGGVEGISVDQTGDGNSCYTGWYSSKWGTWIETALRTLASHGAALHCPFRGEDEAAWIVTSQLGSGICEEESILDVPQSRLAALEKDEAAISRLRTALADQPAGQVFTAHQIRQLLDPQTVPTN